MSPLVFKVVGALLIVIAGSMSGNFVASIFLKRTKQLREVQFALEILETEVRYAETPLPEAFLRISKMIDGIIGQIFLEASIKMQSKDLADGRSAWSWALDKLYPRSELFASDLEVLKAFGFTLGAADVEEQLKHIQLARERLRRAEASAEEARLKNERLCKYLGVLGGLATVVMLL